MAKKRFFTGNEVVAIPDILRSNGGILDISFMVMLYRSVTELRGTEAEPFLEPSITVGGHSLSMADAEWELDRYWIPSFTVSGHGVEIRSKILAPLDHRGFTWTMEVESKSDKPVDLTVGWRGLWQDTCHVINLKKLMRGERFGGVSSLYEQIPYVEFKGAAPLFAVAFQPSVPMDVAIKSEGQPGTIIKTPADGEVAAGDSEGIRYSFCTPIMLSPGEKQSFTLYVGLGPEEISAVTSAMELQRHGWENLYKQMTTWLDSHSLEAGDAKLNELLNMNSFYNYFYSRGITLDTEDAVLLTARSSNHYVTAAYWDRKGMYWSFPAVLQIDPAQARRMLELAFTKQLRNVGANSRFLDGVMLEPGFGLDGLCAPIRALSMYVRATSDVSILFDRRVQTGVNRIRHLISTKKHPTIPLFSTILNPSDSVAMYPYVTYCNVMVWRALRDLMWMYELIHDLDRSDENKHLAEQVRKAILEHCVVNGPYGPMFAWSVDLQGNSRIADYPQGSLELLVWLEFCQSDNPIYINTVKWIHSEDHEYSFHGCDFQSPGWEEHKHPSLLSVANGLLAGRADECIGFLRRTELDDGVACELIDENTGEMAGGGAFASGAGYLAYALASAIGAKVFGPEPEPSDKLYEPPPAEVRDGFY